MTQSNDFNNTEYQKRLREANEELNSRLAELAKEGDAWGAMAAFEDACCLNEVEQDDLLEELLEGY